jgi:hypothetical protein
MTHGSVGATAVDTVDLAPAACRFRALHVASLKVSDNVPHTVKRADLGERGKRQ